MTVRSTIAPEMHYRDAPVAIEWLCRAFGFEKHAVYPGGFVYDDNYIWVVYGKADCQVWIMKMDKKALLDSLSTVSYG